MTVAKNTFAAKSPEAKINTLKGLRYPISAADRYKGGPKKGADKNRKLFSEVLNEIFTANPKRLKGLALRAIEHAEKGHAQFLNLILERLDGPVLKEIAPGNVMNNFFFNDKQRMEALAEVEYIKNLKCAIAAQPELPAPPEEKHGDTSAIEAT